MGIRIDTIAANNVGPLKEFSHSLADLNLIYSQNEGGKTFLTEFVIQRLFAKTDRWDLRSTGTGKVHITGVDADSQAFTTSTTPKLDELLVDESGLPPRLATLLVVKGSDAHIDDVSGGADKEAIKDLLSQRGVLEDIESNINKTVQKADITTDPITIDKRGEGGDLREVKNELEQTRQIIERVETEYSPGELEQLRLEKEQWEAKLRQQEEAKRHKAYQLQQKLQKHKEAADTYSEAAITTLEQNIEQWHKKQAEIERKETALEEITKEADTYHWLQKAKETYQRLQHKSDDGRSVMWYAAAGVFLLAAVITLAGAAVVGVGVFTLSAVLVAIPALQQKGAFGSDQASKELQNLQAAFAEKTGEDLAGLTSIEHQIDKYSEARGKRNQLESDLEDLQAELDNLTTTIRQKFREITGEQSPDPELWEQKLQDIREQAETKRQQKAELQQQLRELQVDPDNYVTASVDTTYDQEKHQEYQDKLASVEAAIADKQEEFKEIRTRIQMLVQADTDDFSILLEQLRNRRARLQDTLQSLRADIIAGRLVYDVITELRSQEDERIQSVLQNQTITDYLTLMTNETYNGVRIDDDELVVVGKTGDFAISHISTGAREQVLMGLRAGMSEYLCDNTPMFMWLDDAFQNTDWQRREKLVAGIVDLVASGWQVTYLTMDDHIRDLFREAGEQLDGTFEDIELQ